MAGVQLYDWRVAKEKKRGRGRPSLGTAARRRVVTVKFTDTEYAELEADAAAEVLPVADYIRACIALTRARGSTR